jgi:phospholipase C
MSDIRSPHEAERLLAVAPDAYHTRRDFLKRTAVTAGLAAGMGLVLDPDTLVAEAARRQREVKLPSPRNLPIDTFVVLMMENRSFDHYLGWLPGADGRQAGLQFTSTATPARCDLAPAACAGGASSTPRPSSPACTA